MSALDLPDIQGIILRGYRMPLVRYFLLKVESPARGRARCWAVSRPKTRATDLRSRRPTSGT